MFYPLVVAFKQLGLSLCPLLKKIGLQVGNARYREWLEALGDFKDTNECKAEEIYDVSARIASFIVSLIISVPLAFLFIAFLRRTSLGLQVSIAFTFLLYQVLYPLFHSSIEKKIQSLSEILDRESIIFITNFKLYASVYKLEEALSKIFMDKNLMVKMPLTKKVYVPLFEKLKGENMLDRLVFELYHYSFSPIYKYFFEKLLELKLSGGGGSSQSEKKEEKTNPVLGIVELIESDIKELREELVKRTLEEVSGKINMFSIIILFSSIALVVGIIVILNTVIPLSVIIIVPILLTLLGFILSKNIESKLEKIV
jgi:hypothetical protein